MTITLKGEDVTARTATNTKGVRSYTRAFKLETTDKTDGPFAIGSTSGLPRIGSVHPEDSGAWCTTLRVDNFAPYKGWRVTAEYSSEMELAENPTNDPALIRWDSEQFQKPAIFDYNGEAIVNSAGDPFDPPNMMDDSRRVVTVTKNLASVPAWILTYQDAINSGPFTIDGVSVATGLAKMQRVAVSERQTRNGTSFRTVDFTIHLQKNGWKLEPLDAGFREREATGTPPELKNIKNPNDDELPGAPVPLDGSGRQLADPTPANCVFLDFDVYEPKDFSILPLT